MRLILPEEIICEVSFDLQASTAQMVFAKGTTTIDGFTLAFDSHPELRYLLILYFYDESIPAGGKAPHAITLAEYAELYRAMFGLECVYTDKHSSIDHLRSHELYNKILKKCGLRFVRGGLCAFNKGVPEEAAREAFRGELLRCFRREIEKEGLGIKGKKALSERYKTLRSYTAQSPAKYLGIPELLEQELSIAENTYTLYANDAPVDWQALLQKHPRLFLSGVSGSGKSTLLKCIALNPAVRKRYEVVEKRLATQAHIYTKGELEEIIKYQGRRYLYLLDGFNELSHNDASRSRILGEISGLGEYPNVNIVISSTGSRGLWPRYAAAQLGRVKPSGELKKVNPAILETPLLCNAYLAAPQVTHAKLVDEYRVLEYTMEANFAAVMAKTAPEEAVLVRIAYKVLLPMLAEGMCLQDKTCFTTEDARALCERLKRVGTEENAMLRHCFESSTEDMPDISLWSTERLMNAFSRLIESGEVKPIDKCYTLRHQRIRDFCGAEYELRKLRVLLSDESDRNIMPHMKPCVSAQLLLRQALGVPEKPKAPSSGSLLGKLIRAVPVVEDSAQFTSTAIKLACTYAEVYEYSQPLNARNLSTNTEAQDILGRVTNWVCEYPEISKALIKNMGEDSVGPALAFTLCKQAELSLDYFYLQKNQRNSIVQCIAIVEQGARAVGSCPRLMHAKAKALMHLSLLEMEAGKKEKAAALFGESLKQLESCYEEGSFLSGNLLAFMYRTPVPFLLTLNPEIRNPQKGFLINVSIATDPSLNGLSPTYARNEAVDALLTGEVSIKLFPGLKAFQLLIQTQEGAQKAIGPGNGVLSKKALKLARALMTARGGTLGDMRPMTVFYEFMIDWYECDAIGFTDEAISQLRRKHMPRLKARLNNAYLLPESMSLDIPFDQLALMFYDTSSEGRTSCALDLCRKMSQLEQRLYVLSDAKTDTTLGDRDHEYYVCRKLMYYLNLLGTKSQPETESEKVYAASCRLAKAMEAFERNYPLMRA